LYFTVVNPSIEMGGIFGESKIEILNAIPKKYKPQTVFIQYKNGFDEALLDSVVFPVILKPDIGERGHGVLLCNSKQEVIDALNATQSNHIIQEYIKYDLELGILYYKMPLTGKTGITSITKKGFLKVLGDGQNNVEQLLNQNIRAIKQLPRLKIEKPELLQLVPQKDEVTLVEPKGNHCLGTEFINANEMCSNQLISIFDTITRDYEGFYFGRFDLKVSDWQSLYRGENIKVFEVNGVSSEPGHIYDSRYNLFEAYKDVAKQMILVSNIAIENLKIGVKPTPLKHFLQVIKNHFWATEEE
jgi:hypothetical protein